MRGGEKGERGGVSDRVLKQLVVYNRQLARQWPSLSRQTLSSHTGVYKPGPRGMACQPIAVTQRTRMKLPIDTDLRTVLSFKP